jgi:hypothetical protein
MILLFPSLYLGFAGREEKEKQAVRPHFFNTGLESRKSRGLSVKPA